MSKPTERFSDRVTNYIKYRPSYPQEVIAALLEECNLSERALVADIGSGTGIFSKLLLERDLHVIGVEPNGSMRRAAETQLSEFEKFTSVNGQAERTTLANGKIDLITAAQAFHWFVEEETKDEFFRILKPGGSVALIWNQRKVDRPFLKDYDRMLLEYGTDYQSVNHTNLSDENIVDFFSPGKMTVFKFENAQHFDLTGFLGRIQSSSYTPKNHTKEHEVLMNVAEELFHRYEKNGRIPFEYDTRLYLGQFSG
jgi:ubiquinone/menaquinone biosynthesis C-methylase UbiE